MNWKINESHNYENYMQQMNIHSLLAKTIDYKHISSQELEDFLNPRIVYHDFSLFLDADIALERIEEALESDEKICIYGDYDCDGILSTTILVQAFTMLGKEVGYHIPNRITDGYGLNVNRIQQMYEKGYSLIITVDNGIKAFDAIDYANELGIDVIVVDHHEYDELPEACAIIHTKLSPDYPFKEICGGFLAYKLASALLGHHDKYLYCLAAITTISDMMPLLDENRSLVRRALTFMNQEKYLQLELFNGQNKPYDTTAIGFTIAPKINSFGRLPEIVNPNHLVKYFLKDVNHKDAIQLSQAAIDINKKRQNLTTQQYNSVMQTHENADFLYVYNQNIHEGLVGLVAGKYTQQFKRPSFVMSYDKEHDCYKGSARSVKEIPLNRMFESLKDEMIQFGGHAMAGGFSVSKDNIQGFKESIENYLNAFVMEEPYIEVLHIDEEDVSLGNVKELDMLEPYGQCNEAPTYLLEDLKINNIYEMTNGKHLGFDFILPNGRLKGLLFNTQHKKEEFENAKTISIVGGLSINKYNNTESINMIIKDFKI